MAPGTTSIKLRDYCIVGLVKFSAVDCGRVRLLEIVSIELGKNSFYSSQQVIYPGKVKERFVDSLDYMSACAPQVSDASRSLTYHKDQPDILGGRVSEPVLVFRIGRIRGVLVGGGLLSLFDEDIVDQAVDYVLGRRRVVPPPEHDARRSYDLESV